ncbi:MAG: c-type cytochrome, partial [Rhodospirillaceae bacterium]|nr:c-type cytochrome [Rhodospirillaceae bacterium]
MSKRRPTAGPTRRGATGVVLAAALLGAFTGWLLRAEAPRAERSDAALKASFRRPQAVPFPADNPYSEAKAALGRRLFFDPRLSGGGTLSCAGCHDPAKNWSDGRKTGRGERGQVLKRRTPSLWNLAWGEKLFWDGRADSLEHQATMPIDNPDEMDRRPDELAAWLRTVPEYRAAFAAAFPDAGPITKEMLAKALATYERTLVSPPAPFDRWIEGDEAAISDSAKRGFRLFAGKANCAACHKGWAFTDSAFHDIGLPGDDRGRGPVLGLPAADHAFKTPSLRDVAKRGPYMHDGSLTTLAAVIAHYETFAPRTTLSADLKRIALDAGERADLVAFLETLSSPGPVDPAPRVAATAAAPPLGPAAATRIVAQRDTQFMPRHIKVARGAVILLRNDDSRTHNVR